METDFELDIDFDGYSIKASFTSNWGSSPLTAFLNDYRGIVAQGEDANECINKLKIFFEMHRTIVLHELMRN